MDARSAASTSSYGNGAGTHRRRWRLPVALAAAVLMLPSGAAGTAYASTGTEHMGQPALQQAAADTGTSESMTGRVLQHIGFDSVQECVEERGLVHPSCLLRTHLFLVGLLLPPVRILL